jgi:acetyl esterase/lipase
MIELTRRNLGKAALVSGLAAAARAVPGLAASPPGVSDEELLASVNPELREYARPMLAWRSGPPLPQTYRDIRKQAASPPQPRPGIPVTRQVIPVPAGVPAVTVYVINAGGTDRPAILHTHGGGFVMGNAGSEVPAKQAMARDLDCVIVTVDYALAPEATYAISTEQTHAALKWLHVNARELGVDRERIALLGESAGGGHAALLALAARDRGEVPVAFQCLVYPMLDDRTGSSRMPPPPIGQLAWDAPANRFGWHSFLGQTPGTPSVPAAAVPARAATLRGLPPAFIGVGSIDLFVDEDIAYARRLIDAGVPTELTIVPGAFHGFDGAGAGTSIARQFTRAKMDALRRAFGRTPA